MKFSPRVQRLWGGWWGFLRQLFIYFPVDLLLRRRENPLAYRLRVLLEELDPIFVKFGQTLSTRSDLLPDEFTQEMEKLQDKTTPFPSRESKEIIAEQLGSSPEELFASFKDQPVAAASLAQVHKARLEDGSEVAVKVRRPGVARTLSQDLDILHSLALWVERLAPAAQKIRMKEAVQEFERNIHSELDFRQEKGHMDEMRDLAAEEERLKIPRTYDGLCGEKVLTTEWLGGIKVSRREELRKTGHDPSTVAKEVGRLYMWQLLELGVFHSDPHPGNIFVLEDGNLGLVDFGTLGRLDETEKRGLYLLLLGAVERDSHRLARTLHELGMIPRNEVASLEEEIEELIDRYYQERLEEIKLGHLIYQTLNQVIRKHDFSLPTSFSRLGAVAITVENLCESLDPEFRWSEAVRAYSIEGEPGEAEWKMLKERIKETTKFFLEAPGRLDRVLTRLESGELAGPSRAELEDLVGRVGVGGSSIGLGLATAALVSGGVFLLAGDQYQAAYAVMGVSAIGFFRLILS